MSYIILKHQPVDRDKENNIVYKPLKWKPKISEKYYRYIPVTDSSLNDILTKRVREQAVLFEKKIYGENLSNYSLFFNIINKNTFRGYLVKAHELAGLKYKSPHKLRHAKALELAREKNNFELCKYILGHTNIQTTERYIHLAEERFREEESVSSGFMDFLE